MVTTPLWIWLVFNLFVVCMLAFDLGLAHKRGNHAIKVREALKMTLFWICLALAFNVLIYFWRGPTQAMT
ncbi:MAG TPA: TerC family protein, partial [Candidatus Aminicenantes bacterium]|nr:TerC family protein [Candidatus Aminicenantes bacterium]